MKLNQEFKLFKDGRSAMYAITLKSPDGELIVESAHGQVYWPFGIRKAEPKGWALDHLPTGYGLTAIKDDHSKTKKDIAALLNDLREMADWDVDVEELEGVELISRLWGRFHFEAWKEDDGVYE